MTEVIVQAAATASIVEKQYAAMINPAIVIPVFIAPVTNKSLVELQDCQIPPEVDKIICVGKDNAKISNDVTAGFQELP